MTESRETSHWGWGYRDKFSSKDERRDLADMIEGVLGFPERPILEPTSIKEADLPPSSVDIPEFDFCSGDRETRIKHTYGKAYRDLVRGFHGDYSSAPDLVAQPRNEDDVKKLLEWASNKGIAVVPYGGGTSVVGGVEAHGEGYGGVVSLDMRHMNEVLDVDPYSRSALIQAGARGPEIQESLEEHGLQLRHYPQSYEFSTLGGWIATRAGGHFATLYTHIDDFVESVRLLAPAGTLDTRRLPASGAGPDPNRLVLGSEGVLGVVTKAWMRVQPRPTHRARATVHFDDYGEAVEAVRRVVQARLYPANCRLLDSKEAMLNQISVDGSHVLFLGFESTDHPIDHSLDRAVEICRDHGGSVESSNGGGEEGDWRSSFFEAPYRFNDLVSLGVLVDTFETAVTWDQFEELHTAVKERVTGKLKKVCGTGYVSSRFTHVYPDGPAPYYTMLAPIEPGREIEQWRRVKEEASEVIMEYGGTITHHHAVGRVHKDWYRSETPEEFRESIRRAKRVMDPEGIMNPGALVDPA